MKRAAFEQELCRLEVEITRRQDRVVAAGASCAASSRP